MGQEVDESDLSKFIKEHEEEALTFGTNFFFLVHNRKGSQKWKKVVMLK